MKNIIQVKQKSYRLNVLVKLAVSLIISTIVLGNSFVYAQFQDDNYANLESYIIAKKSDGYVYLYKSEEGAIAWDEVGNTNRKDIQSLSIHITNNTIYAVNKGELGTLNKTDGSFNAIGNIGDGGGDSNDNGEHETIAFENIYGLTYSYTEDVLYASQRTPDDEEDLLLKIDPETGALIQDSFIDSNDNLADYVIIQAAAYSSNEPDHKNVVDLVYDPLADILLALQVNNYNNPLPYVVLSHIDMKKGSIVSTELELREDMVVGGSANIHDYWNYNYPIYTVTESNFNNAGGAVESKIKFNDKSNSNNWILDIPLPNNNVAVLDFDYVQSPCKQNLVIKENTSNVTGIPPLQRSSETIVTEQTSNPTSWDVVVTGQRLDFKSNHITLQPGFHVLNTACFNAEIEPCQ